MSKIALTPNSLGSGTFTLASPNSDTDRTLTLPDEAGTVLTSASTLTDLSDVSFGEHTYTVTGSTSGSWTPRSNFLTYFFLKYGRLVHVSGKVETQGTSSPSGNIRISLPYNVSANPTGGVYTFASGAVERNFSGAKDSIYAFAANGYSYFELWNLDEAGSWTPLTSSTNPSAVECYFSFSYVTDA